MSNGKSAKSKASKGEPAGTGRRRSSLQEAHSTSDPIIEDELRKHILKEKTARLAADVSKRQENRKKYF